MKKMSFLLLMLLGSIFTLQSCSDDDDEDMMSSQVFVNEAASSNMFEIQTATLAKSKSDNASIEMYADHMLTDHGAATTDLMALVTQHNLTAPTAMLKKHQDQYDMLAAKTGTDFEKGYAKMMVDSHQEAIVLFETGADKADKQDFRNFASSKLPTLNHHLEEAVALNAEINP